MFQQMKKRIKNEKGLTLIELLAVIVILGIIAAIAIPAIGGIIENSKFKAVKADALNVHNAAQLYFTDHPSEADVLVSVLKSEGYLDSEGTIPVIAGNEVEKVTGGNKLTTTEIDYSNGKKVKFVEATVKSISEDTTRGSSGGTTTLEIK